MFRRVSLLLLALAASAASASCPDLPGAAALFAPSMPRIIWVGEMHGTNEMPALFGDLVCIAGESGRKVVVALERPRAEQLGWDRFLRDGDEGALKAQGMWVSSIQDGRSSKAMLALAARLRAFAPAALATIEPDHYESADERDAGMAATVRQFAQSHPDAVVLVYSGDLHAMKGRSPFPPNQPLAASLLPTKEVESVLVDGGAGTAWARGFDGREGPELFPGEDHPRGIVMGEHAGYDAVAYTGQPTTASPPAITPPDK